MNKKTKFALVAVGLMAAAGATHIAISSTATKAGKRAIEALQKSLPAGGTLSYGNVKANGYRNNGAMRDVFYDSPKLSITASTVRIRDFEREGEAITASVVGFEDVVIHLKDKGIRYSIKRAVAHDSNLIELVRSIRRSTPQDLARMLKAREIIVTDITSSGKGTRIVLDEARGNDVNSGTIAKLQLKGLAAAEGGPGKSVSTCAGDAIPVERVGELAATTVDPSQDGPLVGEIGALCK